jgi:1-acyl-sn-glycerol-3-phosphate acyltransferase
VVPAGIIFPDAGTGSGPVPEHATMEIRIGAPLVPPRLAGRRASPQEIRAWHATVMGEIARLSGKTWEPLRGKGGIESRRTADAA